MLETDLFALLENTADAAYTVNEEGEICSWNAAATELFGYEPREMLGRLVDDFLEARDKLGTDPLAGGEESAARRWKGTSSGPPNFDLEVRRKSGERIWVNVSTIVFDNQRTGRRLFVRLMRDISHRRRTEDALRGMVSAAKEVVSLTDNAPHTAPVEVLSEQERRILTLFAKGANPAFIARELSISSHTLRNHLHHINRKLRTHNRLQAVTHARLRGLID